MAGNPTIDEAAAATMRANAWEKGVLTGAYGASVFALAPEEPKTEIDLRNEELREEADAETAFRLAEMGGFVAGRIQRTGASGNDPKNADGSRDGKKAAKRGGDGVYLAALMDQLDQLNADIARLDSEIAGLEREIADIEDRVFTPEEKAEFDGLPEDEQFAAKNAAWQAKVASGERTKAEYQEWLRLQKELAEKKEAKAEKEQELEAANDKLDQEREAAERKNPELAEKNQTYEGRSETIDQEAREDRADLSREAMQAADEVEEAESRLLRLEDLKQYEGQPEYIDQIDAFVAAADEKTIEKMSRDETLDPMIAERVAVHQFGEMYDRIQSLKGTDNYDRALNGVLGRIDPQTRNALVNDEDTPEDVIAAIYEALDEEPQTGNSEDRPEEPERSQVASANPPIAPQI